MPVSPNNELGAEQWPQALLFLLMIAIAYNIFKYFKTHKKEDIAAAFAGFLPGVLRFGKSKLFLGMIIMVVMALVYETLGFLTTCLLFMAAYGVLLGERRPLRLIISSVIITLILYIGFAVLLGLMLPRGYVPFLRNFAILLEMGIQRIRG
jgi:hypothetical protein